MLAAGTKNVVAVWDLVTGQLLWSVDREPEEISSSVLFSPESELLAVSTFHAIDVYDVPTGQHLANHDCRRSSVSSVAFSADGDLLGVGGAFDGAVDIRDVRTGQSLSLGLEGPPRQIMSVAFSPDGQVFAAASNFGYIRFWSLPAGNQIHDLVVPLEDLGGPIAFSADSSILTVVAGGLAAAALSIEQWDVASGKQLTSFESFNWRAALSQNGEWLIMSTIDDQLEFADVASGRIWHSLPLEGRVKKLVLSPDSRLLAVIGDDSEISFYGIVGP
jgi:WD40 repeat protein